jgi:hypothetical protein
MAVRPRATQPSCGTPPHRVNRTERSKPAWGRRRQLLGSGMRCRPARRQSDVAGSEPYGRPRRWPLALRVGARERGGAATPRPGVVRTLARQRRAGPNGPMTGGSIAVFLAHDNADGAGRRPRHPGARARSRARGCGVRLRRADCRGQAHASGQPIKTITLERDATPASVAQDVERLLMKTVQAASAGGSSALRQPHLPLGFGLSTGKVAPVLMGSGAWLEYTDVGDTVNIAQRRQGRGRPAGRIVLRQRTDAHSSCPSRRGTWTHVGETDGSRR